MNLAQGKPVLFAFLVSTQVLFFINPLFSQNVQVQSYTSFNGLSQNDVQCIAQTNDGLMWFGTIDGLNSFDGSRFISYKEQSDSSSVTELSRTIITLLADKQDQLWVGTINGVALFDRYVEKFVDPKKVYRGFSIEPRKYVKKVLQDSLGNIWICTNDSELYCYNIFQKSMVAVKWASPIPEKITSITIDPQGLLWLSSTNGLYTYRNNKLTEINIEKVRVKSIYIDMISFINQELWMSVNGSNIAILNNLAVDSISVSWLSNCYPHAMPFKGARQIHQSNATTVWIGTMSEGVIKINLTNGFVEKSNTKGASISIKSKYILDLYTNNRTTWIGQSDGGVAKYVQSEDFINLWSFVGDAEISSPENWVVSMFTDNDKDYYLGTMQNGLSYTGISKGNIRYYPLPDSQKMPESNVNSINKIISGNKKLLWLATAHGLYSFNRSTLQYKHYKNNLIKTNQSLTAVHKLKKRNAIFTGSFSGNSAIFNIDTKQWEPLYDPDSVFQKRPLKARDVMELEEGTLLIATQRDNLVKYNYITGKFYVNPELKKISKKVRHFNYFNNYYWIGTDDGLIQATAPDMKVKKVWSTKNGLSNNVIHSILPDNNGRIWVSSNKGLNVIDPRKNQVIFIDENLSQNLEYLSGSCYKDKNGLLFFGGTNGVNKVQPHLLKEMGDCPAPFITNIDIMNTTFKADTNVRYLNSMYLPYYKNFIDFEFQSPEYTQTGKINYRYMLTGVDEDWVYNGNRNHIKYTQLRPGKYRLLIQASSGSMVWSKDTRTLNLTIAKPWFKERWVYVTSTLLILLLTYSLHMFRVNQALKLERMRKRISADLHDDIGSTLTGINLLTQVVQSENISNEKRNEFLGELSNQSTEAIKALKDIIWGIDTEHELLVKDIERMNKYADNVLASTNIKSHFVVDSKCKGVWLGINHRQNLYLVFKEAVNNAVKYSKCTEISVLLSCNHRTMLLEIADNGVGFDMTTIQRGNGLSNMEKRAGAINGEIQIQTTPGKGTVINLSFKFA